MSRIYKSGGTKKRLREEKKERQREILKKVPKLTSLGFSNVNVREEDDVASSSNAEDNANAANPPADESANITGNPQSQEEARPNISESGVQLGQEESGQLEPFADGEGIPDPATPSEGDPASVSINETKTDVGCWGEITEEVGPVILSS